MFSFVILTFNRIDEASKTIEVLLTLSDIEKEIIVVDNGTNETEYNLLYDRFPHVSFIRNKENVGVVARNQGIKKACGNIVITLDDDVRGITTDDIKRLELLFNRDSKIAAICFKVLEPVTNKIINWCHPLPIEQLSDVVFETDSISEGAVAFKRSLVLEVGLYPENFFISHEGADLAFRLLDAGYKILIDPKICVYHYRSKLARSNWRRYYFDTRNAIWLAVRNLPFINAVVYMCCAVVCIGFYALRDGYMFYWVKAIFDALYGIPLAFARRRKIARETLLRLKVIRKNKPSLLYKIKKRMFQRGVEI